MPDDSRQLEMLGNPGVSVSVELQEEVARNCRSRHQALVKCYELSNLAPKEVYDPLGLTQSTFSRIMSGDAYLPHDMKFRYMKRCGNIIPVRYDVLKLDHEMKPVQTELEARLEQLEKDLQGERQVNRRLVQMLSGRGA